MKFLIALLVLVPSLSLAQAQSPLPEPVPNPEELMTFLDGAPLHTTGALVTEEVAEGVFIVTDGVYQAMVVVRGRAVVLVDAPPSLGTPERPTPTGQTLLGAIREITDRPVRHLIYTHEHIDHIGGAAAIDRAFPRVRIYAHMATQRLIREARRANPADPRVLANRLVYRHLSLRSGSHPIRLSHLGTGHSPGDLFVHLPRQRVLMRVDVVFPGWAPFSRLGLTDHVAGYIRAHEQILAFDFDVFVAGHLTRPGTRHDVERSLEYTLAVRDAAANALASEALGDLSDQENVPGPMSEEAFLFFQNPYGLFEEWLRDVEARCVEQVLSGGRFDDLAGVDIYTRDNCSAMQNALRIDFQVP